MKHFFLLLPLVLSSCVGYTKLGESSNASQIHTKDDSLQSYEQWFIVEKPGSVTVYQRVNGLLRAVPLNQYERYQIAKRPGQFYHAQIPNRQGDYLLKKTTKSVAYDSLKHPNPQMLVRISTERTTCGRFRSHFEAQKTYDADPVTHSELDVDDDGVACEQIAHDEQLARNKKSRRSARKSPSARSRSYSSGKSVQCRGTTQKGNRCRRMTRSSNGYCYQHG